MPVMMNTIQQDWHNNKFNKQDMMLANPSPEPESMCGFCDTIGKNVRHTPDTISRILQALNINTLPLALSKPELNERIGLCDKCEDKIKVVEHAAGVRESLTSLLLTNLKHLSSTCTEPYPKLIDALQMNGQSPHSYPFAHTIQKTNEITPQQHSIKRKISSIVNGPENEGYKRRQLKGHNYMTVRTEPIKVNGDIVCANSSDEENMMMVNDTSSVSPHSTYENCTPPPISPSTALQQSTSPSQILSEMTRIVKKRRKQARPTKVAGDIVPAVPKHEKAVIPVLPLPVPSPTQSLSPYPQQSISPVSHKSVSPASHLSTSPFPHHTSLQVPSNEARSRQSSTSPNLPAADAARRNKLSVEAKLAAQLSTAQLAVAQTLAANSAPFPFGYSSLYPNNITDLFSTGQPAQSTASPAPTLHSLYNVANTNGMMAMNNPVMLSRGLHLAAGANAQYPTNTTAKSSTKSTTLLAAKKEPKAPLYPYHGSVSIQKASDSTKSKPEEHTLIKTDKRRYCKVCAAANRKANNGRPPQSRFLCEICSMPMCRSCIEEHRFMIIVKANTDKGDVKASASAKLLQAVKMKDKASNDSKPAVLLPSTKTTSMLASAPPSHSSIIYGCPSTTSSTSSVSSLNTAINSNIPQPAASLIPAQLSSPIDMRLPQYQNIAPAPPKHLPLPASQTACSDTASADTTAGSQPTPALTVKQEALPPAVVVKLETKDEEAEGCLVIAEELEGEEGSSAEETTAADESLSAEETAITAEMASKTVAMLMSIDDDESVEGIAAVEKEIPSKVNQSPPSISPVPSVSTVPTQNTITTIPQDQCVSVL